jgi:predicted ATPase
VFRGGFTLEAAEAVTDTAGLGVDPLATVTALVDKALIQVSPDASDEPRFSLLETLREFAWERLEASGERATHERQHAA